MNQLTKQQYADLAKDAYETRQVTGVGRSIPIGENQYRVLAVHNNPRNGYQGAVYQDVRTNEIIVAHRGTEELLDGLNDATMVSSKYTAQAKDAIKMTEEALRQAQIFHQDNPDRPKPRITPPAIHSAVHTIYVAKWINTIK